MSNEEKLQAISKIVNGYKAPKDRGDDFNPGDASGGNFDDCYAMGSEDGECYLADVIKSIVNP